MDLTIIVPTYNEGLNVVALLKRIGDSISPGILFEVLFVDDSTDTTPQVIRNAAITAGFPVRLLHRERPTGGLGGAVVDGITSARANWCLIMDGDLQHPPEDIPKLLSRASVGDVDIVVASRYVAGGHATGLADATRTTVSRVSTLVTKSMFPRKLGAVTDPMTGFFLVNREAIDVNVLRPRGFKILLEILARRQLRVAEVPFDFAPRAAGKSKASITQGVRFLTQLTMLRFGRMSAFALVGGFGAIANLAIMWALVHIGVEYLFAAVVASVVTIIGNFLLLEYLVYADMRSDSGPMRNRFAKSFTFNASEALIRIPLIWVLVEATHISSVLAAGITLIAAFVVRFVFHSLVVYRPHREIPSTAPIPAPAARDSSRMEA